MNYKESGINGELLYPVKKSMPSHNKQDNKDPSEFPEMTNSTRLSAVNLASCNSESTIEISLDRQCRWTGFPEDCEFNWVSQDFWLNISSDRQVFSCWDTEPTLHNCRRVDSECYLCSVKQLINMDTSNNLIPLATNQSVQNNVASVAPCPILKVIKSTTKVFLIQKK